MQVSWVPMNIDLDFKYCYQQIRSVHSKLKDTPEGEHTHTWNQRHSREAIFSGGLDFVIFSYSLGFLTVKIDLGGFEPLKPLYLHPCMESTNGF